MFRVLSSVKFYDNLFLMANKVHYILAYRLLSSEFQTKKPLGPQLLP